MAEITLLSSQTSELRLNCLKLVWRPDKLVEQNIEAAKVALDWINENQVVAVVPEKRKPGRPKMSGIPVQGSDE